MSPSRCARIAATLVICFIVAACGGAPSPTPDAEATKQALFLEFAATLTAEAPTATITATATATTEPTATSTPTVRPTPAPTATATPLPTPTPEPVVAPEGWVEYASPGGAFTVYLPSEWELQDEGLSDAAWAADDKMLTLGLFRSECSLSAGDDTAALQCLWREVSQGGDSLDRYIQELSSAWSDGVHNGYVVEVKVFDYVYESWSYRVYAFCPEGEGMIGIVYVRFNTESITDSERELVKQVFATFRGP